MAILMAYTNIAKPTSANYTNVNSTGRQQYDDPAIAYDDSGVFYDSVNYGLYTNIAKPAGTSITILRGSATGLLIPLTTSEDRIISTDPYTRISKPTL